MGFFEHLKVKNELKVDRAEYERLVDPLDFDRRSLSDCLNVNKAEKRWHEAKKKYRELFYGKEIRKYLEYK